MTSDPATPSAPRRLRTPRSAAIAGIIFAVLLGLSMALIQATYSESNRYDPSWLTESTWTISVAVALVPFAGVAFLWFMGVIRDHFGDAEDRFFATVFLGSGYLLLASMFVWIALLGSAVATASVAPEWAKGDSYLFASSMIHIVGTTILLRMAGVFVFSTSAIWVRTGIMPRWIGILSIGMGLVMFLAGGQIRLVRFIFPAWVLFVSVVILIAVRRRSADGGTSP